MTVTVREQSQLQRLARSVCRLARDPALLILVLLAALGAEGRRAYSSMLMTSDMVFPLVYATALSMAFMLVLCRRLAAGSNSLCLFP